MPKEVILGDIVNESLHIFEEKIQRADVQLSKKIEPQPPVLGYADEIRQVIDNLLLNALEATPPGCRLAVAVHRSRKWSNHQQGVRLTMADSGCGTAREKSAAHF